LSKLIRTRVSKKQKTKPKKESQLASTKKKPHKAKEVEIIIATIRLKN
jgi:hypothetical protein